MGEILMVSEVAGRRLVKPAIVSFVIGPRGHFAFIERRNGTAKPVSISAPVFQETDEIVDASRPNMVFAFLGRDQSRDDGG